jgi:plasmid stabilization system protein ParE
MNVVYAPRALRDLKSISLYLLERNPTGAANVLGAIKSSIETLAFFPQIGRLVDNAGHLRVPVVQYPYVIFYRIEADELLILHVRHTARRPVDPTTEL